jgi:hypothetical protein
MLASMTAALGKLFLDPVERHVSIGRSNIQKARPRAKKFCERSLSLVDSPSIFQRLAVHRGQRHFDDVVAAQGAIFQRVFS